MNLNLWNQLSMDEKEALERFKGFGITDQDIKDVIRMRGCKQSEPSLEDLETRVRWATRQVNFYAPLMGDFARGQEQMYRRVLADYARDLDAQRERMLAPEQTQQAAE